MIMRKTSMKRWATKIAMALGLILIVPLIAHAVTTQPGIPVPTVEQASYDYDAGSVRFDCDNVLLWSEASSPAVRSLDQVFGFVAV